MQDGRQLNYARGYKQTLHVSVQGTEKEGGKEERTQPIPAGEIKRAVSLMLDRACTHNKALVNNHSPTRYW